LGILFTKKYSQATLIGSVDDPTAALFIETVVNSTPALFCVLDEELRIVQYNDALEALCGRPGGEETSGRLFHKIFAAPREASDVKRRLLSEDEDVEHENAFRRGDGASAIVSWVKRRVIDADGRPRIFFSGIDVTTQKQEQRELRASRARVVQAADATRRTRLANERTYLAWWRTGLTALAVSLAAGRVVPTISHGTAWPYELAGSGFAVLGVLCIYTGYQREREIDRALEEGRFATLDPRINLVLTTVGVILGIFTLGLIVVNP